VVLMAGANLATPLYAVYADRFGFSTFVLTAIFATYAFVLVPGLLVFGRVADRFGRRRVLVAGLGVASAALVVFAGARGAGWLFAARALQGLAVALVSGAATAALVELDPDRNRRRAALLAGLAQAGGSALGPLVAGVLVQWAPAPRQLSYLLFAGLSVAAAAVVMTLPGRSDDPTEPWRIAWPRVPSEIVRPFARVGVTAGIVWGAVALYLSVMPSYARDLIHTRNLALLSAVAAAALAASCVAQVAVQRRQASLQGDQALGLALLAAGLVLLVLVGPLHSLAVLLAGALLTGAGHGVGVLSAQEELNRIAPAERRAEVTAAFVGCVYFVVASSVIASGLLDEALSLTASVATVAIALALCAAAAAAWQARTAAAAT
jgi:MFS family permease